MAFPFICNFNFCVFVVSHLLLILHSAAYKHQHNCPESFDCGTLGQVKFPFSNSTDKGCGLYALQCSELFPTFNLGLGQPSYEVVKFLNDETVKLKGLDTLTGFKSCDIFSDSIVPGISSVSFTIMPPKLTLFRCNTTTPQLLQQADHYFVGNHRSYGDCSGFTVFYEYPPPPSPPQYHRVPMPGTGSIPPNCVSIQVPVSYSPRNDKASNDIFSLIPDEFSVKWHVSNDCLECRHNGGQCLSPFYGFKHRFNPIKFRCITQEVAGRMNYVRWILVGSGVLVAGIVAVVAFFYHCTRDTSSKLVIFWKKKNMTNQNVEAILKKWGTLAPKRYCYSDIKKMTFSFKEKLGQGGYGTVYKGNFKTGHLIAVKVLNKSRGHVEEFINEVTSIGQTSHINIVTLLGFCLEGDKRALVYEFMCNGSLEKFIHDENSSAECRLVGWETLYQIAIGIARGLEYLHCGCNTRILHLDIKPQNILLDEDFCPKISDFGLAKICPKKESIVSMSGMRGTAGYIAPEVFSRNFGGVSHKSDVYSYGMMLLNMVVGGKNVDDRDHTSEEYFPDWIYRRLEWDSEIGHGIMNEEENEKARNMTIVGLWCIQINPSERPAMSRVLDMLEGSIESLQIPPNPYFRSPQRILVDMSTDTLALSSSTNL